MESFSPLVMEDLNLDKGLGGIVQYVLARLYTIEKEKKIILLLPIFMFFI